MKPGIALNAHVSETLNFDEFPYSEDGYPGDWMTALDAAEQLEADLRAGPRIHVSDARAQACVLIGRCFLTVDPQAAYGTGLDRETQRVDNPRVGG